MTIIMSVLGVGTLLAIAVLFSSNRRAINLRTVSLAFALQLGIAALILYVPKGDVPLNAMAAAVQTVIDYANVGISFLFGDLSDRGKGFKVAFHVLPVIVFFSALMATLYYLRVMQTVIRILGGWVHTLLKTSRVESMTAVANIFIGHTESPLVVRPYINGMTQSELFTVMTVGCATIAGAVMASYAAMGIDLKYLITASFMGAPGGLLMAKLMMPETDYRDPTLVNAQFGDDHSPPVNIFEAIANGTRDGLMLALNVGAMLLAFVAMIALLNGIIGGIGGWFGAETLTFESILGWVLKPLAFLLGVPWNESQAAGSLIGQKFVVNEFVAYLNLSAVLDTLSPKTQIIATFALCGFANLSSIAILLGGLGSLAPSRRPDIARMGLKAVVAGTLSNLMSAALAGLFFSLRQPL